MKVNVLSQRYQMQQRQQHANIKAAAMKLVCTNCFQQHPTQHKHAYEIQNQTSLSPKRSKCRAVHAGTDQPHCACKDRQNVLICLFRFVLSYLLEIENYSFLILIKFAKTCLADMQLKLSLVWKCAVYVLGMLFNRLTMIMVMITKCR